MILNYGGYAAQCLVLYVILGIAWYFFDSIYGVKLYRWFYNLSHKEPMPAEVVRGFMYGQSTKKQARVAFLISTGQSIYMIWGQDVNLLVELILWLLEIPAMLIGVWLGGPIFGAYKKRDNLFETVDRVKERAEDLDLEDIRKQTENLGHRFTDSASGILSRVGTRIRDTVFGLNRRQSENSKKEGVSTQEPAEPLSAPPKESRNPLDILNQYTKRG